ncbi:hypothetical protein C1X85_26095 [Pseudomonas sp. GP01-A6]|nr:hypothetical protein C1X85_26095 [Pseudomonas sp. GP01-A6]
MGQAALLLSGVAAEIAFASKPAPTFDRVSSGGTRSNVGAGLPAKRPSTATHLPSRLCANPCRHSSL